MSDELIRAVKRGDLLALRNALRAEPNIDAVDSQGWTPLFHAAHHGNAKALELLIEAGANVNHGLETGFTALFSAVFSGHIEAVRTLLSAGAKIAPVQGIELRTYCTGAYSDDRHRVILAMLNNVQLPTSRKPGEQVVLTEVPPGLVDGLPPEDQEAIRCIVGIPVLLKGFDEIGRAELAFEDRNGVLHHIYVSPKFIEPAKS